MYFVCLAACLTVGCHLPVRRGWLWLWKAYLPGESRATAGRAARHQPVPCSSAAYCARLLGCVARRNAVSCLAVLRVGSSGVSRTTKQQEGGQLPATHGAQPKPGGIVCVAIMLRGVSCQWLGKEGMSGYFTHTLPPIWKRLGIFAVCLEAVLVARFTYNLVGLVSCVSPTAATTSYTVPSTFGYVLRKLPMLPLLTLTQSNQSAALGCQ